MNARRLSKTPGTAALTVMLATLALSGQVGIPAASVEGIVRNQRTGDPVSDVRVTATPEGVATGARTVTTDATGRFVITGLNAGRYAISAARTLFFTPRSDGGAAAIVLLSGERLTGLQIFLAPTGVIAGRVVGEQREPLRAVRVEALRGDYRDGTRTWTVAGQGSTDDRGEYRVFDLQPGSYLIRATRSGPAGSVAPLYYPGLTDPDDGAVLRIEPGMELSAIDVRMFKPPEYFAQVQLDGVPEGTAATFVVRRRETSVTETVPVKTTSLGNEEYQLGPLVEGAYELFVMAPGPGAAVRQRTLSHTARIPFNISRSDEDLGVAPLEPAAEVTGRLTAPDTVTTRFDPRRAEVTLRSVDLPVQLMFTAGNPGLNADGTFTIPNVVRGLYRIQVRGLAPEVYLISANSAGRDVLDSGLTVSAATEPLQLTLGGSDAVGVVDGVVVNNRAEVLPSRTVVLVPPPERRSNSGAFMVGTTDQSGSFTFRAVPPGDYRAFAWDDAEPGAYLSPGFLNQFEGRGELVRVIRGGQVAVTVRLISANGN